MEAWKYKIQLSLLTFILWSYPYYIGRQVVVDRIWPTLVSCAGIIHYLSPITRHHVLSQSDHWSHLHLQVLYRVCLRRIAENSIGWQGPQFCLSTHSVVHTVFDSLDGQGDLEISSYFTGRWCDTQCGWYYPNAAVVLGKNLNNFYMMFECCQDGVKLLCNLEVLSP